MELQEGDKTQEAVLEGASDSTAAYQSLRESLNTFGRVDLDWMTVHSGLERRALKEALEGEWIIQNPADGQWMLTETYLNGNLRERKTELEQARAENPEAFEANVRLLQSHAPARVSIEDIHLSLGAPWIPEDLYSAFVQELLSGDDEVCFNPVLQSWKLDGSDDAASYIDNHYTYGTELISARQIITQTLNAKTVTVMDKRLDFSGGEIREKRILNKNKTMMAQEKQKVIIQAFDNWCRSDIHRMDRLEDLYNDMFGQWNGMVFRGDLLDLPGLNDQITLYAHQKDAIAKALFSENNLLLAHEVGSGKTYEMVCSAHEMIRLGKAAKVLITVPNNVLQDIAAAHQLLYKDDDLIVVTPSQFTKPKRAAVLEKIAAMEKGVVYMPYSSFDLVKMSQAGHRQALENVIARLRKAKEGLASYDQRAGVERRIQSLARNLVKENGKSAENMPGFDELGIDVLFVDEAHNYKNIPLQFKADHVIGMHVRGSAKCEQMLEKCQCVKKVVFATGTPLTNSIADLFALQTYLQPDALVDLHIESFDLWINTFARRETSFEVDVDSSGLRVMTRFATFHNLPELMNMFSVCCDFHYANEERTMLPAFHGYTNIALEKSPAQARYIQELAARTERIRSKQVDRHEDNLLLVTVDGRKCALDLRLAGIQVDAEEIRNCKISRCAAEIVRIYKENPGCAQLVFSDLGTPCDGFNVYDELRRCLEEDGIPSQEIAYIHDASNEKERAALFAKVNAGQVRVIIGSTQKLGVGVNVQERLVALHHLSVPWRPADMVQREGRIIRQGNTCEEVFIYRYVTSGSFDSYSWQLLESKQRFISSFLSGTNNSRTMEDIADSVLSYADVKALAIGNPLIRERIETGNKLERARNSLLQRNGQLKNLHIELNSLPSRIEKERRTSGQIASDYAFYQQRAGSISQDERQKFGRLVLKALGMYPYEFENLKIAVYRGFGVFVPRMAGTGPRRILIEGPSGLQYQIALRSDKEAGISRSVDFALAHLGEEAAKHDQKIEQLKKDTERARREIALGNSYEKTVADLQAQLAHIDAMLQQDGLSPDGL